MSSEARVKAQKKYNQKLRAFSIKFQIESDKDVIEKLESMPCITKYVRELIRRDIKG